MSRPSEDEIIARYLAPLAGQGAFSLRDDAALLTACAGQELVISKDILVSGVHFFADDPPDAIARKALRVNLSDLAAKAAAPRGFLLGLALPRDWTEPWLAAFCQGLGNDSRDFACPLLGGDTTATPGPLMLSITVVGEIASGRMVPRPGTRAGDVIFVTGTIGDAALGLRLLRTGPADRAWTKSLEPSAAEFLRDRYLLPRPRLKLRAALADAHAAMDVSDGLVGDLTKMLALEGLGARVAIADIPMSPAAKAVLALDPDLLATVLTGGDDYEVLCAVPPGSCESFRRAALRSGVDVHEIATAAAGPGSVEFVDGSGIPMSFARSGFDHFA